MLKTLFLVSIFLSSSLFWSCFAGAPEPQTPLQLARLAKESSNFALAWRVLENVLKVRTPLAGTDRTFGFADADAPLG